MVESVYFLSKDNSLTLKSVQTAELKTSHQYCSAVTFEVCHILLDEASRLLLSFTVYLMKTFIFCQMPWKDINLLLSDSQIIHWGNRLMNQVTSLCLLLLLSLHYIPHTLKGDFCLQILHTLPCTVSVCICNMNECPLVHTLTHSRKCMHAWWHIYPLAHDHSHFT